jgi:hypothetical protein
MWTLASIVQAMVINSLPHPAAVNMYSAELAAGVVALSHVHLQAL